MFPFRNVKSLWSEIHFAMWYQNMYVADLVRRGDTSATWRTLNRHLGGELRGTNNAIEVVRRRLGEVGDALYGQKCMDWYVGESKDPPDMRNLPKCPCTRTQAAVVTQFEDNTSCSNGNAACNIFHRGATHCIRSAFPR